MKLVHVQTIINTVFGELDGEGNIVNKRPLQLEVPTLSADLLTEAVKTLAKVREDGYEVTQPQAEAQPEAAPEKPAGKKAAK